MWANRSVNLLLGQQVCQSSVEPTTATDQGTDGSQFFIFTNRYYYVVEKVVIWWTVSNIIIDTLFELYMIICMYSPVVQ